MSTCCDNSEALACVREAAACQLSDTATVKERTLVSNGRGGHTETWATLGTADCRIVRLKEPVEVVNANKVTVVAAYKILLPASTTLSLSGEKRIIVNNVTFEIVHADTISTNRVFTAVFCNLVQ